MRRVLVVLIVALAAFASSAMSTSPAVGSWTSIDAVDDSLQTLRITPSLRMVLNDEAASSCSEDLSQRAVARGQLTETSPTTLAGTVTVQCQGGTSFSVDISFTHDPGNDTLQDGFDPSTTWQRR